MSVRQLLNHTSGIVDYHYLGDAIDGTSRQPKALDEVISRRRIAIQVLTTRVPYFADGLVLQSENWSPVVLVPARAANLDTPHRLMRTSQRCREMCIAGAKKIGMHGFRLLTPQPMRFTADRFAL